MFRYLPIRRINAREILDSRGNPTLEVEVTVGEGIMGIDGYTGRAMVPSGASTGSYEAVELRDEEENRYGGKGVTKAAEHVNTQLAEVLVGENALNQEYIDYLLKDTDGTENKPHLGANALLGTSMAVARAAAKALRMPLYRYLGGGYTTKMPVPMMNVINGGAHTDTALDFQEFMIIPGNADSFAEALRMGTEIYHTLKKILKERGFATAVGDEGGFAPDIGDAREVFKLLSEAVTESGYRCGEDVYFALDAAASELYDRKRQAYVFAGEGKNSGHDILRTTSEMITYYQSLADEFPLISIEDGLREDDWEGWQIMTSRLGDKMQLVGDDLFVTNPDRVQGGIHLQVANAVLVKLNQIGTLTEAMKTIRMAQSAGYRTIISHRSGETEDTFISDLAIACGAGQIKTGAPCRTERTSKYNQLLRIEEYIGCVSSYECPFCPKKLE